MISTSSKRPTTALTCVIALSVLSACSVGTDTGPAVKDRATVAGQVVKRDEALHDLLPEAVKQSGTVRVATDVPYPPFVMQASAGSEKMTGLDYDLGQALGAKLGVRFEFTAQKFDGIVPALQAGKFDVAMSAITDNKDRQKVVDFVDYSESGSGIMVAQGNPAKIRDLNSLCGRKVSVQAATNQLKLLTAHQAKCAGTARGKMDIQTFPKDSDAQLALRSGKVVADVLTKPAAGWTAKTADDGKTFDLVDDPKAPGGYRASPNGIAVTKKLPELTTAIQKALQVLMDNGMLTQICDKYGVEAIALRKATKNAAVD